MRLFKNLFKDNSKIKHLKSLIVMQKEIIEVHTNTLYILEKSGASIILKSLIQEYLKEAKQKLESYEEDLKKLES